MNSEQRKLILSLIASISISAPLIWLIHSITALAIPGLLVAYLFTAFSQRKDQQQRDEQQLRRAKVLNSNAGPLATAAFYLVVGAILLLGVRTDGLGKLLARNQTLASLVGGLLVGLLVVAFYRIYKDLGTCQGPGQQP